MADTDKLSTLELNPVHGSMGLEMLENRNLGRPDKFPIEKLEHLLSDREDAWPQDSHDRFKRDEDCILPPIHSYRQYTSRDIGNEFKGTVYVDQETRAQFVWPEPVDTAELERERIRRGLIPPLSTSKKHKKPDKSKQHSTSPEKSDSTARSES